MPADRVHVQPMLTQEWSWFHVMPAGGVHVQPMQATTSNTETQLTQV